MKEYPHNFYGVFSMAQPNKYKPTVRFSNSPYNSSITKIDPLALDTELVNISDTISDINKQLELLQRDDGKLRDSAIDVYQDELQAKMQKIAEAAAANASKAGRDAVDEHAPNIIRKLVDDYLRSLKTPDPQNPKPSPNPGGNSSFNAIMRGYALFDKLREAQEKGDYVYLDESEYFIQSTIKLSAGNNNRVKGIIGKGRDKTIIRFAWQQVMDWDSETNLTDARLEAGILVNGVNGKEFKDFAIKYEGEFYRKKESYFGSVSCINIQNSSECTVDNVEVSGANRAGIYLGASGAAIAANNKKMYLGAVTDEATLTHPRGNTVKNCYTHHNRVAGIFINNQIAPRILNNVSEYNGHVNDGGTGYGITAASGSVNIDVKIIGNTTRHNYRKGIDSHDAYDFEVRDNRSEGDRFFGIAVEGRGYPQRRIVIENNTIIQDPDFRLDLDDEHDEWESHKNMDYYRYTAIRIENKSQVSQAWRGQPENVEFIIRGNNISGVKWDGRGTHCIFEIRNNENAEHVKMNALYENNTIQAESVHYLLFAISEAQTANGLGNLMFRNNNVVINQLEGATFYFEEKNARAVTHGGLSVVGNTIEIKKLGEKAWCEIACATCASRKLVKVNGNTFKIASATKPQFIPLSSDKNQLLEIMNNTWETATAKARLESIMIGGNLPKNQINFYNNKLGKDALEPVAGAKTSPTEIDPSTIEHKKPEPRFFEKNYRRPDPKVAAPDATIKFNFASAEAGTNSITADGSTETITKAGTNPPAGYAGLVGVDGKFKVLQSRLLNGSASSGVWARMQVRRSARNTLVFAAKVMALGQRAAVGTGFIGYGLSDGGTDSAGSGGAAIRTGSDNNHFIITKTAGVYVNGVPYDGEELSLNKTYVFAHAGAFTGDFITLTGAWNGNGISSANVFDGVKYFDSLLTDEQIAKLSVDLMDALEIPDGKVTPQPQPQPDPPPAPKPADDRITYGYYTFDFTNIPVGTNEVAATPNDAKFIMRAAKQNPAKEISKNFAGMVVENNGKKVARSSYHADTTSMYIETSAKVKGKVSVIFAFMLIANGSSSRNSPLAQILNGPTLIVSGNGSIDDGLATWKSYPANGWRLNNAVAVANRTLDMNKWFIGQMTFEGEADTILFGLNNVKNLFKTIHIGEVGIAVGLNNEEVTTKVKEMAAKFGVLL